MLRFGKKSKLEGQYLSNLVPLRRLSRKRAWMGVGGEGSRASLFFFFFFFLFFFFSVSNVFVVRIHNGTNPPPPSFFPFFSRFPFEGIFYVQREGVGKTEVGLVFGVFFVGEGRGLADFFCGGGWGGGGGGRVQKFFWP